MQLRVVNEKPGKCSAACSSSVRKQYVLRIVSAESLRRLGNKARALEWLEKAYEERSRTYQFP
jgi:hypothetical protein